MNDSLGMAEDGRLVRDGGGWTTPSGRRRTDDSLGSTAETGRLAWDDRRWQRTDDSFGKMAEDGQLALVDGGGRTTCSGRRSTVVFVVGLNPRCRENVFRTLSTLWQLPTTHPDQEWNCTAIHCWVLGKWLKHSSKHSNEMIDMRYRGSYDHTISDLDK